MIEWQEINLGATLSSVVTIKISSAAQLFGTLPLARALLLNLDGDQGALVFGEDDGGIA